MCVCFRAFGKRRIIINPQMCEEKRKAREERESKVIKGALKAYQ